MTRSSFDSAVARHGLSAVRQMSGSGMPVLSENPVRRCVSSEANVSAPGEGVASRSLSGAVLNPVAKTSEDNGRTSTAMRAPMAGEASRDSDAADRQRPALSGFTGDDDGRPQASGGAAPVITHSQSALTPAETAPANPRRLPEPAGAVNLSDATMFILRLIAAHEGRPERDIVAELVAAAGIAIGLSPLLTHAAGEIGDLSGLPDYARRAANRFRGGVP